MNRIFFGLAISGLLTLFDIYPVHSRFLPALDILKNRRQLVNVIMDTLVEVSAFKRNMTAIKSPEDALTLSRFHRDGQIHTLAVLLDDGETLTGVDISKELNRYDRNSFDVIKNLVFDDVVKLIRKASRKIKVKYSDLLPSVEGKEHLAIGINYADHGKETGQVKPFMFPKLVETDPAIHRISYTQGWLLDHEVELGIVFPSKVCSAAELNRMLVGFLVVNDFTDRATLMRKMDSQNVTGGKGFPDAKSKRGFLPTGPYLVIPRNWRHFVKELHLNLSVNEKVRQNGYAKDMVWNIDKIIEQSLSVKGKKKSFYQDKNIDLFQGQCIPANCIIITGTPSGVVFNAPSKRFIIGTVAKYMFTGGFFKHKMHPYVLQQYLKKELKNPRYLKPGDQIETSISFLGSIKTTIEK